MFRDQTFADDTAFYLKGTKDNMDKVKKVLDTFYLASGAHINWCKSCAIWAAKMGKDWNWGQDIKLKWVVEGEGTRYLGVQIGFHLATKANFVKLLDSLKKTLISLGHNCLSFMGRILVANQVLLSSKWYLTVC
jgi:hypothetical protein